MFTERLCGKGIGNVLNFRIEISLANNLCKKVKLNSFKLKVLLYQRIHNNAVYHSWSTVRSMIRTQDQMKRYVPAPRGRTLGFHVMLLFCYAFTRWNSHTFRIKPTTIHIFHERQPVCFAVCRFGGRSRCLPFGCLSNGVLASKKSTEK